MEEQNEINIQKFGTYFVRNPASINNDNRRVRYYPSVMFGPF